MQWMSVKLADNFQIREHSWPMYDTWNEEINQNGQDKQNNLGHI
jgi:hypothetical protein